MEKEGRRGRVGQHSLLSKQRPAGVLLVDARTPASATRFRMP